MICFGDGDGYSGHPMICFDLVKEIDVFVVLIRSSL